ncbi:hypothetical protein BBO99_00007265 [Phytophthora kernoviae]|uniref:Uncharacterized protein n=2 Tax=Phytophthora kernoviae TaxID=325452 RepID=A0A3R7GVR5_9STRA|nr:hypothetical protein G195_008185 [Phytophthora kernoviae 00238/432]KAG2520107.1 hypothetical protein JM16_006886 [Phytophthora kernoviae]KAG2520991.1 hypothetical protein JM18_006806 [Phytophthora kernoviae]RLN43628.1 hypothetical protein BBI17_007222 [Phytophthora kernoviae]RLN76799.1 hypothetical protein BBO99_00007265 [Phytophthora kernoviae]
MDLVWGRFQDAYPRRSFGLMDDDVGKLSQPLMSDSGEDSDSQDEEMGGLLQPRDMRPQFEEGAAARRKRRRRKEDEDLAPRSVTTGSSLPSSLSTQMLTHRRKENLEETSNRALALMAVLTLGFCMLLLFVVYQQSV